MLFFSFSYLEAGNSELDLIRLEGIYEIDAEYTHLDGTEKSRLDRLIIFRNQVSKNFTIALAISKYDIPFIVFKDTQFKCEEGKISLEGEGEFDNGIYGEIKVSFKRDTLELEGVMTDSVANGYKHFTGKPIYNLSMCLFQNAEIKFPNIDELVGEYIDEDGDLLIIRTYSSGSISAVMKKLLSFGEYQNIQYSKGSYQQNYGLIELPWRVIFTETKGSIEGKTNITYRIDDSGKPYLKLFSTSTAGNTKSTVKKFYFKRKVLELPEI